MIFNILKKAGLKKWNIYTVFFNNKSKKKFKTQNNNSCY